MILHTRKVQLWMTKYMSFIIKRLIIILKNHEPVFEDNNTKITQYLIQLVIQKLKTIIFTQSNVHIN